MPSWLIKIIYKIIRVLFVKTKLVGLRNMPGNTYSIFVANHEGAYGPLSIISSLSINLYPWVVADITDPQKSVSYIEEDFTVKELNLKRPLSLRISIVIGRICVAIMKGINAIPVYKKSHDLIKTMNESLRILEEGKALLIFPEEPGTRVNEVIGDFHTGFIKCAKLFYERSNKIIGFYPVAVNRKTRIVHIGSPVYFNPAIPFKEEKNRIKRLLMSAITEMYGSSIPQKKTVSS
jgi:1-acyl-sn-glycerol-3-phosphate acyltransferase